MRLIIDLIRLPFLLLLRFIRSLRPYNLIEVKLQDDIPEEEPPPIFTMLSARRKLTLWNLEDFFLHAARDPKANAVSIKIKNLSIGWARGEAIRRGILDLRRNGKKVFVYLESPGNLEYMIATAADRIYMPPWSMLNLIGLRAEVTFLKDALDKLGVEAQLRGVGEYKSAAETFTRSSMSPHHREMIDSLMDDLYSQFVGRLAQGRDTTEEKIKGLIDSGPYVPQEALESGLIDGLAYQSEFEEKIKEDLNSQGRKIRVESYLKGIKIAEELNLIFSRFRGSSCVVALLCDTGAVMPGESKERAGIKTIGPETITNALKRAAEDNEIKALVMRISTPGGSGTASDLIWHELKRLSEKKPVVVSMSDVAASGGYLISLGGRKIVAEPLTLTGSIGIISGKFNLRGLSEKLGITKETAHRGSRALMFSSYRGFSEDEYKRLSEVMDLFYEDFVEKVAGARAIPLTKAKEIARGRVWTGNQAKNIGLVDTLGGIREAIELAKKEAGIPEDLSPVVRLLHKPIRISLSSLGRRMAGEEDVGKLLELLGFAETISTEKALALAPFLIRIL